VRRQRESPSIQCADLDVVCKPENTARDHGIGWGDIPVIIAAQAWPARPSHESKCRRRTLARRGIAVSAAEIRADLIAGLNPGVRLVPSHVMALGLFQERGVTYVKV
jgi:hypothetical protein